jgi:hypothetical protein
MNTPTTRRPAAISVSSRRTLGRMFWASSLIISSLVMLIAGFLIGKAASNRLTAKTRGIT